jgi:hypothetical protein
LPVWDGSPLTTMQAQPVVHLTVIRQHIQLGKVALMILAHIVHTARSSPGADESKWVVGDRGRVGKHRPVAYAPGTARYSPYAV